MSDRPIITRGPRGQKMITYKGKTLDIKGWAKELGISNCQMSARMREMPEEKWFVPSRRNKLKLITVGDETKTVEAWAKQIGLAKSTVFQQLANGVTIEELLKKKRVRRNYVRRTKREVEFRPEIDDIVKPKIEFEPDLEIRRRIVAYQLKGMDESEILIKLRLAA